MHTFLVEQSQAAAWFVENDFADMQSFLNKFDPPEPAISWRLPVDNTKFPPVMDGDKFSFGRVICESKYVAETDKPAKMSADFFFNSGDITVKNQRKRWREFKTLFYRAVSNICQFIS